MNKNATSCSRVNDDIFCLRCKEKNVVKNDRTKNNKQQYYCKICPYRFIENYTYRAYKADINQNIIQFTKEGLGIRNTARILKISTIIILKMIVAIAKNIQQPIISEGKTFEVNEICPIARIFTKVSSVLTLKKSIGRSPINAK